MRGRYQATRKRAERGQLLDELVRVAGYTRKHAITLMNQSESLKPVRRKKRPGRPRSYQHCLATIEVLWETLDYCCAQRLHPQLTPLSACLARHGEIQLTQEVKQELASISRATLARRLPEMHRPVPRTLLSGQHPSNRLKLQVRECPRFLMIFLS